MSAFSLPKTLCNEFSGMLAKFGWGSKENKSKIHWIGWGKMEAHKFKGGMGF